VIPSFYLCMLRQRRQPAPHPAIPTTKQPAWLSRTRLRRPTTLVPRNPGLPARGWMQMNACHDLANSSWLARLGRTGRWKDRPVAGRRVGLKKNLTYDGARNPPLTMTRKPGLLNGGLKPLCTTNKNANQFEPRDSGRPAQRWSPTRMTGARQPHAKTKAGHGPPTTPLGTHENNRLNPGFNR